MPMPITPQFSNDPGGFGPDGFQRQGQRTITAQLGGDWQANAAKVRQLTRGGSTSLPMSTNTTSATAAGGANVIPFPSTTRSGDPMSITPTGQTGAVIGTALLMANEDTSGGGKLGDAGEQGFMPPPTPIANATPVSSESEWANPYGSGPGAPPAAPPVAPSLSNILPRRPPTSKPKLNLTPFFVLAALLAVKLLK